MRLLSCCPPLLPASIAPSLGPWDPLDVTSLWPDVPWSSVLTAGSTNGVLPGGSEPPGDGVWCGAVGWLPGPCGALPREQRAGLHLTRPVLGVWRPKGSKNAIAAQTRVPAGGNGIERVSNREKLMIRQQRSVRPQLLRRAGCGTRRSEVPPSGSSMAVPFCPKQNDGVGGTEAPSSGRTTRRLMCRSSPINVHDATTHQGTR